LELLGVVADRRSGLPIVVCVSSRDELDAVCAAVANLPFVSLSPLVCLLRCKSIYGSL
jgi:translation initiation factor 4A